MKKILVIDDNEQILDSIQLILEAYGYEVVTSTRGEEVTHFASFHKPHIIILDMFLGSLQGVDLAAKLHTNPKFEHIPILLMTANHNLGGLKHNTALKGIIQKPFEIEELIEKIEQLTTTNYSSAHGVNVHLPREAES